MLKYERAKQEEVLPTGSQWGAEQVLFLTGETQPSPFGTHTLISILLRVEDSSHVAHILWFVPCLMLYIRALFFHG